MPRTNHTDMGSKNVSLREDVYRRLKEEKDDDESFSEVVERLLDRGDHPLYELVGTLDDEEVERIRERTEEFRRSVDEGMGRPV